MSYCKQWKNPNKSKRERAKDNVKKPRASRAAALQERGPRQLPCLQTVLKPARLPRRTSALGSKGREAKPPPADTTPLMSPLRGSVPASAGWQRAVCHRVSVHYSTKAAIKDLPWEANGKVSPRWPAKGSPGDDWKAPPAPSRAAESRSTRSGLRVTPGHGHRRTRHWKTRRWPQRGRLLRDLTACMVFAFPVHHPKAKG